MPGGWELRRLRRYKIQDARDVAEQKARSVRLANGGDKESTAVWHYNYMR